jgi:hypothetical protein
VDAQATTGDIAAVTLLFVSFARRMPKRMFHRIADRRAEAMAGPQKLNAESMNGMKLLFIG